MLRRLATGDEWWRPLPPGVSADVLRVLAARGVRAFGDGFVALLLPIYLVERGFSALAVGTIVTGTLVGTALMTLWVDWIAALFARYSVIGSCATALGVLAAAFPDYAAAWTGCSAQPRCS
jgi:MFS family permease